MVSHSVNHSSQEEIWVGLLVTGNGRYGYFAVRADKVEEFRNSIAMEGEIELPEYVLLLTEGKGRPSEEVLERIEKKKHLSPHFVSAIRSQRAAN